MGLRDFLVPLLLTSVAFGIERRDRVAARAERGAEASNVILVVADGLRWQEVMRGADASLLKGAQNRYDAPSIEGRRQALMPFVWGTMARQGTLYGNRDIGSRMGVTNRLNFSYPGYNELLVGFPDKRIDRNDFGPNPNVTVFEWLNGQESLANRVAVVGAWDTFHDIFNRERSRLPIHASRAEPLDARAHAAAMHFLTGMKPRALFVAYVETDDYAHKGDYAGTLDAAHRIDAYIAALWRTVQSDPMYRGRTTLIFTADHGRGRASDWTDHGPDVAGSNETWVAMIGPGFEPAGAASNTATYATAQIAATVAATIGYDLRASISRAAPPIVPRQGRATAMVSRSTP